MVEKVLKNHEFVNSKNHLYRILPNKVMQQTLSRILEYLEESNKIIFNKDGSIVWFFAKSTKFIRALKGSKKFKIKPTSS
jgi:hypothetical protein